MTEKTLTLLSINNYYYRRGGAEVVFLEHNQLFSDLGWTVVPFSMKHPKNLYSEFNEQFVEELEYGRGHSWYETVRRASKALYSFEARQKIGQLIDSVSPDICHAHNIYHHISPAILSLVADREIPIVITLHDLKLACPAYGMWNGSTVCESCKGGRFYQVALQRCMKGKLPLSLLVMVESYLHAMLRSYEKNVDRFVVPSRFYLQKLVEWGFERKRFAYIPNFVDCDAFHPRYKPGKRFVYFGSLSKPKGVHTLISASALAGTSLTIVGSGSDEKEFRTLADKVRGDVQFLGFRSGQQLHDVIREARAVVVPSEWYENAPLVVLEAYALGKPVLGSTMGGIPELILENRTGLLFPAGSVDELAAALNIMSESPDSTIEAMGREGRKMAKERYSPTLYIERMNSLYGELGICGRAR